MTNKSWMSFPRTTIAFAALIMLLGGQVARAGEAASPAISPSAVSGPNASKAAGQGISARSLVATGRGRSGRGSPRTGHRAIRARAVVGAACPSRHGRPGSCPVDRRTSAGRRIRGSPGRDGGSMPTSGVGSQWPDSSWRPRAWSPSLGGSFGAGASWCWRSPAAGWRASVF